MTKKVAALMAQIDEVLKVGDRDAADVWALLTAMRGPDDESKVGSMDKHKTTCVLRAKVFPQLGLMAHNHSWPTSPFMPGVNTHDELPKQAVNYEGNPIRDDGFGTHAVMHFNEALRAFRREDPKDGNEVV